MYGQSSGHHNAQPQHCMAARLSGAVTAGQIVSISKTKSWYNFRNRLFLKHLKVWRKEQMIAAHVELGTNGILGLMGMKSRSPWGGDKILSLLQCLRAIICSDPLIYDWTKADSHMKWMPWSTWLCAVERIVMQDGLPSCRPCISDTSDKGTFNGKFSSHRLE